MSKSPLPLSISITLVETDKPDPECQCEPKRCVLFDGEVTCSMTVLHPQYYNMLGQVIMQLILLDQHSQPDALSPYEWHQLLESALTRVIKE